MQKIHKNWNFDLKKAEIYVPYNYNTVEKDNKFLENLFFEFFHKNLG